MTRALVVHPGTQHAFCLAAELQRHGRLIAFHTGLAVRTSSFFGASCNRLPVWVRGRLANRMLSSVPAEKLRLHLFGELSSLLRGTFMGTASEASLHRRNERFQRSIPDADLKRSDIVVGFDTSSWLIARRVKAQGGKFVLDQSIGHPIEKERIFTDLRERYPAWRGTVPRKAESHMGQEQEEHRLADLIVVPSSFVSETLISQGVPQAKIRVVPFGTDLNLFKPAESHRSSGAIVFLFVGSISARKGVPVLLEAWRRVRAANVELWLVGPGTLPSIEASNLPTSVHLLGPKTRLEVAKLMQTADVFVFPSRFEGLAQVQIEALATGLPLIGTKESGAEELVRNGHNGFIVPADDTIALTTRIQQVGTRPELLDTMRRAAAGERDRLSWSIYGDRWSRVLDELR